MDRTFQVAGSSSLLWGQVCALWRSFFLQGLAGDALLIFKRERKNERKKKNERDPKKKERVCPIFDERDASPASAILLSKESPKKGKKKIIKTREGKEGVTKHAVLG